SGPDLPLESLSNSRSNFPFSGSQSSTSAEPGSKNDSFFLPPRPPFVFPPSARVLPSGEKRTTLTPSEGPRQRRISLLFAKSHNWTPSVGVANAKTCPLG